MSQSLDPAFRAHSVVRTMKNKKQVTDTSQTLFKHYFELIKSTHERCLSVGMDQGIHNWLVYSGDLEIFAASSVVVFKQGEGPVNTLGKYLHCSCF
jgi:hypothetical protein